MEEKQELKKKIERVKKLEDVTYQNIINRMKRLGSKEASEITGFDEGMITSWIFNIYQPSEKQIEILKKELFKN